MRFEGPHDFEPCTPTQQVTIALDAPVLFDTSKAQLKPEARQTLHEAAERIEKFADVHDVGLARVTASIVLAVQQHLDEQTVPGTEWPTPRELAGVALPVSLASLR